MKIFALSDIHTDYRENAQWIKNLSIQDYQNDILILAGDISKSRQLITDCFKQVARRFKLVIFVPGNHDLWIDTKCCKHSIEKFKSILELASDHGISMKIQETNTVRIIPLLGWYDYSFGPPSKRIYQEWMDYIACKWPNNYSPAQITQYFTQLNQLPTPTTNKYTITFSHFLPRIDVMPTRIPKDKRYIYPVLGSQIIEQQLRTVGSQLHIYGHSHVNQRIEIDGTIYLNNAFGYPRETRITQKRLIQIYPQNSHF